MATPRKFSEKIALHNQKQAEETAAFEQIMREVSDATSRVNALPKQHLLINQALGAYRGGSLPNVNHIGSNSVDAKSPTGNIEEQPTRLAEYQKGRAGGGPIRPGRTAEKRVDTSPYNSNSYLSPPPENSWRRTASDSALHQSAMNTGTESNLHSTSSQRRVVDGPLVNLVVPDFCDPTRKQFIPTPDGRPRSSCEVPRVPGINIYPSQQEPGTIQIPIGNNTGSLPDLTNFHFPSPLPNPLDHEDPSSSPYSTSPQGTSPSTLSPSSLSSRPAGRFSFGGGGGGGGGGSPQESQGPSPGHSPGTRRRHYPQAHLQNLVLPSGAQHTVNHLSVPSLVNARYLHTCKGVTVDSSNPLDEFQQNQYLYQQQQMSPQQQQPQHIQHSPQPTSPQQTQAHIPQQQPPTSQQQPPQQSQQRQPSPQPQPPQSPSLISNSQSISPQHLNSLNTYRSPQPLSRPSPQTSPGLTVQASSLVYRSGSPGEASHSSPQSPVSPASPPGAAPGSSSPFLEQHTSYVLNQAQAAALQQHFEQFSMVDNPVTSIGGYMGSQNSSTQYSQAISHTPEDSLVQGATQELTTDPGYYSQSPSQLQYNRPVAMNPSGGSTQQTTPQTPNTPSSIPDIILTDFSSSIGDDLSHQEFVKDLGSAMSGSFDTDLFPTDETFRDSLGPIDFESIQMLTDPETNVITDPATEDNFRRDRLLQ